MVDYTFRRGLLESWRWRTKRSLFKRWAPPTATAQLRVPRGNLGGAFIQDAANSYSAATLAKKDGFGELDARNYENIEIRVCDGGEAWEALAVSLKARAGPGHLQARRRRVRTGGPGSDPGRFQAWVPLHGGDGMPGGRTGNRGGGEAQRGWQACAGQTGSRSVAAGWSRGVSALRAGGHAWRLVPYAPQGRKTDLVYYSYEA